MVDLAAAEQRVGAARAWWRVGAWPDLAVILGAAEGRLFIWLPVMLGAGICLWFALPDEPGVLAYGLAAAALLAGLGIGWAGPSGRWLTGLGVALVATGFLLAGARAHQVAAPVLGFRYYGPIEGRVVAIDRSARDRMRLTLDGVVLRDMASASTPARVRLALMDDRAPLPPLGTRVMLTGHLGPPPGPSAPGAYDFRRQAWFLGLGAIGYARDPVMVAAPAPRHGWSAWLQAGDRLRLRLSAAMQAQIGGQAGGVAAALMTGDRSGIAEATNQIMRDSNLYHIVSISGLHMAMVAGFVLSALRIGLALIAARGGQVGARLLAWPVHKLAAAGALMAASLYLWLAGANVATERAFIMVAVMLLAILADRRALSLRALALAALIILLRRPESVTEPGFQMSFAATAALILSAGPWGRVSGHVPALLRPAALLVVSSVIASLSTAPLAAAHFNRMAEYGLIANLLVVPVMGTLVMPAGVIAALLAPLGLAGPALWVMGLGTRWMLAVAEWIAGLDGAVSAVASPPWPVVPLLAAGALITVLMSGRWRWLALAPLALGAVLWLRTTPPDLLIAPEGELAGLMTPTGRVLSKTRGGSFVADSWLAADGDTALAAEAAVRAGFTGPNAARRADYRGWHLVHLTGARGAAAATEACQPRSLVISDRDLGALIQDRVGGAVPARALLGPPSRPNGQTSCLIIDQPLLRQTGALALWLTAEDLWLMKAANEERRLWLPENRRSWDGEGRRKTRPDREHGRDRRQKPG